MTTRTRTTRATLLPITTRKTMARGKRGLGAAATMAIGGVLALAPTPASASVSQGYVVGAGVVTDDWGDEGPLSASQHSNSYAVGLWQWVLWAEAAPETNGTAFDLGDIDCRFGANTTYATKQLQKRWRLSQDGIVGKATFSRADNELILFEGSGFDTVAYSGSEGDIYFNRDDVGVYTFPVVYKDDEILDASYSAAPAEVCEYGN
ncbi:peptidoglycan-binding protein [Streptomyces sp. NPDC050287]|uniref:peptidoglycan-binding protein n=1 Tax=Streptomyces sp. NPDC050287 TaxID=3365608 RepID=UPI00379187E7